MSGPNNAEQVGIVAEQKPASYNAKMITPFVGGTRTRWTSRNALQ
jgi:hypothetical protein